MKRFSFTGLRLRLCLLVFLAVTPALVLMFYRNIELRQMVVADVEADALRLTRLVASDQQDSIRDTRQHLFALAQLPEVHSTYSGVCSTFFAQLLRLYPQYTLMGVIAPDGDIFCSAYPTSGPLNVAEQDYFQRVLSTSEFAISDYQTNEVNGKANLSFGYPVINEANQIQAIVFASLDLTWLNQLAAEAQLPAGSTFTLIDRNGTILVRYPDPEAWVGRTVPEVPVIDLILSQHTEGTAQAEGVDGISRLYAFSPLPGATQNGEVYISIGIPTNVAFADANRLLTRNLIALGLVTLLALAAAWFGGDFFILRWVRVLVATTKRLSAGDLSVRTGLPHGPGELSQLAHAFDEMADSLERYVIEQTRRHQADTLLQVASVVSATLELDEVLARILDQLGRVVDYDSASVQLLQEGKLKVIAARGFEDPEQVLGMTFSMKNSPNYRVISEGQPLNLSDAPQLYPGFRRPLFRHIRSWLGVPLRVQERIIGIITIDRHQAGGYDKEEVRLTNAFADLAALALENAQLYQQAEQLAVMEERSRLARELHDSVTQSLYSLTLFAEVQRRAADSANLEQVIDYSVRLGQVAQQALKEMRLLVYELRTAALETEGLVGAVQQRLDAVEKRAGVEARLVVEAMVDLPAVVEEGLYRIAQEALNNALKHAAATSVTVRINADNEQAVLEISDNGRGFAPNEVNTGGMGLSTMRERAERLGGQFTITATPGKGTRVSVTIPARRSWSRPLIPIDIFSEVSQ
jgi:signal transduction histidine kinase